MTQWYEARRGRAEWTEFLGTINGHGVLEWFRDDDDEPVVAMCVAWRPDGAPVENWGDVSGYEHGGVPYSGLDMISDV